MDSSVIDQKLLLSGFKDTKRSHPCQGDKICLTYQAAAFILIRRNNNFLSAQYILLMSNRPDSSTGPFRSCWHHDPIAPAKTVTAPATKGERETFRWLVLHNPSNGKRRFFVYPAGISSLPMTRISPMGAVMWVSNRAWSLRQRCSRPPGSNVNSLLRRRD
jgi:hypothetical protein